ncbi:hypothetical protein Poly30_53490 [Planctomycetes bacterium Poly30]|uniref:Chromosome partition protein Smc n=1 Tax=Saltatorellus ferox TaxID=2528018 RepID=A0A518F0E1_9BACT|nr:hypothetical protein Poly30_53490 [Planctomycetes bacterium Poly30]
MKLTLATCALGALGLTPALHGALEDPVAPAPPVPLLPPVVGLASVPRASVPLANVPLAPAPPATPYVALLRQDGQQGLEKDAARLKEEIARLRKELDAMQKEMKNAGRGEPRGRAEGGRSAESRQRDSRAEEKRAIEREFVEERARSEEQRARSEEQRARLEEQRERVEEMRERAMEEREEARERLEEMREEAMERAEEAREEAMERSEEARERSKEALKVWTKSMKGRVKDGSHATFEWKTDEGEEIEAVILRLEEEANGDTEHVIEEIIEQRVIGTKGQKPQVFRFKSGGPGSGPRPFGMDGGPGSGGTGAGIRAGGPNTFNIHVEEGDVHIHTSGGSSITTSKGMRFPGAVQGLKTSTGNVFFGATPPVPALPGRPHEAESHEVHVFGRAEMKTGEEPIFSVNINGKELDLSELEGFFSAAAGEEGEFPFGMVLGEIADMDFEALGATIDLEALEALEGLEDILEMDFDVEFEFGEGCDDEECCDDECAEDEIEEIEEEAPRDDRFVAGPHFGSQMSTSDASGSRLMLVGPQTAYVLAGQPPATAPAVAAEAELLELARQIQADVQAMRAELNELRSEVLGAPRRQ